MKSAESNILQAVILVPPGQRLARKGHWHASLQTTTREKEAFPRASFIPNRTKNSPPDTTSCLKIHRDQLPRQKVSWSFQDLSIYSSQGDFIRLMENPPPPQSTATRLTFWLISKHTITSLSKGWGWGMPLSSRGQSKDPHSGWCLSAEDTWDLASWLLKETDTLRPLNTEMSRAFWT